MDYAEINKNIEDLGGVLVCVSKTRSNDEILDIYHQGQRIFGENRIPEMVEKQLSLPQDISWHMIGHLQTNKVKYIASFVDLIHSVDSKKLLLEVEKQGKKNNRIINVLLQLKIAEEASKLGADLDTLNEMIDIVQSDVLKHVCVKGLMGMASFVEDEHQIKKEFRVLYNKFTELKKSEWANESFEILSMGMSGDYTLALIEGSTMVRIGSKIFNK